MPQLRTYTLLLLLISVAHRVQAQDPELQTNPFIEAGLGMSVRPVSFDRNDEPEMEGSNFVFGQAGQIHFGVPLFPHIGVSARFSQQLNFIRRGRIYNYYQSLAPQDNISLETRHWQVYALQIGMYATTRWQKTRLTFEFMAGKGTIIIPYLRVAAVSNDNTSQYDLFVRRSPTRWATNIYTPAFTLSRQKEDTYWYTRAELFIATTPGYYDVDSFPGGSYRAEIYYLVYPTLMVGVGRYLGWSYWKDE